MQVGVLFFVFSRLDQRVLFSYCFPCFVVLFLFFMSSPTRVSLIKSTEPVGSCLISVWRILKFPKNIQISRSQTCTSKQKAPALYHMCFSSSGIIVHLRFTKHGLESTIAFLAGTTAEVQAELFTGVYSLFVTASGFASDKDATLSSAPPCWSPQKREIAFS